MGRFQQRWTRRFAAVGLAGLVMTVGCSEDSGSSPSATPAGSPPVKQAPEGSVTQSGNVPSKPTEAVVDSRSPDELIAAGRSVYNANCIACHNMNPVADGALGPAVAGSSLELLTARVVRGDYPEGYTPKRASRVMIPLAHLEPKLPELAAYLQSLN